MIGKKRFKDRRAVSTVFGTLLFMILFITVCSVLFMGLYSFNSNVQQANSIDDARSQERFVLSDLIVDENKIVGLNITNSGAVTIQVKAFYLNGQFICDPSNSALNPEGAYVNTHSSQVITVTPISFDPSDTISIATSRGVKAIELESKFIIGEDTTALPPETYYGPLRLNFTLFYYREVDSTGKSLGPWVQGSTVPSSMVYCAWKVTVTNIDTRTITLSRYTCLTLVTNDNGGQYPWYTNYPGQVIVPNQTVTIVFIWTEPLPSSTAQGFQGFSSATSKVFLTFYGSFSDGTDYGQTVPFEAILRM